MSRYKKIIINASGIVVCVVAVACILYLPFLYLKWSNNRMFDKAYPMSKIDISLESDVADIEMVSRLHTIIGNYYEISSANDYLMPEGGGYEDYSKYVDSSLYVSPIIEQINVMLKKPALKKVFGSYFNKKDITPLAVNVFYLKNSLTGVSDVCNIIYSYDGYDINIIYDSRTDKVVELGINDYRNEKPKTTANLRRKAVKAMLEYLNLEIVGDFECSGTKYSSEKAHITMTCEDEYESLRMYVSIDDKFEITNNNSVNNNTILFGEKDKMNAEDYKAKLEAQNQAEQQIIVE